MLSTIFQRKIASLEDSELGQVLKQARLSILEEREDSERGIFGFSYVPLEIVTYFGFLLVVASFIFIVGYILLFLILGNPIPGFMTIISLVTLLGGVQILAISIVGKYIIIIFEETKRRPEYVIKEIINDHRPKKLQSNY